MKSIMDKIYRCEDCGLDGPEDLFRIQRFGNERYSSGARLSGGEMLYECTDRVSCRKRTKIKVQENPLWIMAEIPHSSDRQQLNKLPEIYFGGIYDKHPGDRSKRWINWKLY